MYWILKKCSSCRQETGKSKVGVIVNELRGISSSSSSSNERDIKNDSQKGQNFNMR